MTIIGSSEAMSSHESETTENAIDIVAHGMITAITRSATTRFRRKRFATDGRPKRSGHEK